MHVLHQRAPCQRASQFWLCVCPATAPLARFRRRRRCRGETGFALGAVISAVIETGRWRPGGAVRSSVRRARRAVVLIVRQSLHVLLCYRCCRLRRVRRPCAGARFAVCAVPPCAAPCASLPWAPYHRDVPFCEGASALIAGCRRGLTLPVPPTPVILMLSPAPVPSPLAPRCPTDRWSLSGAAR